MGWNGSDRRGDTPVQPKAKVKKPSPVRISTDPKGHLRSKPLGWCLIAGGLVCVLAVVVYFLFFAGKVETPAQGTKHKAHGTSPAPAQGTKHQAPGTKHQAPSTPSTVAQSYNEQVKEFVKKSAGTNNIHWIVPPLAPDDPDRALHTRVTQELGSLLSVEPGEQMPPFPYSFLIEDDMKARGEDTSGVDNGNKGFLESLKKLKIQAKETDDEHRLEHKQKLIEAQSELLAGIDEGISVNDSIRAAYEFRKRAYEMRSTIINTLSELHQKDGNDEDTIRQVKDMNNRLAEEGIKKISIGEVIPDYEEPEEEQK